MSDRTTTVKREDFEPGAPGRPRQPHVIDSDQLERHHRVSSSRDRFPAAHPQRRAERMPPTHSLRKGTFSASV